MEEPGDSTRSKIIACLGLALGFVGAALSGATRNPIVILITVWIFYAVIRYGFKKGVFSNTDFED
jgi:hypothetical protein